MLQGILDFIVRNAIVAVVGVAVVSPIATYLASKVAKIIRKEKQKIIDSVKKIQDPDTRKMIESMILEAEKAIGSGNGRKKFNEVKKQILAKIPDIFDPLIGAIIQAVFDELVAQSKIN